MWKMQNIRQVSCVSEKYHLFYPTQTAVNFNFILTFKLCENKYIHYFADLDRNFILMQHASFLAVHICFSSLDILSFNTLK